MVSHGDERKKRGDTLFFMKILEKKIEKNKEKKTISYAKLFRFKVLLRGNLEARVRMHVAATSNKKEEELFYLLAFRD